MQYNTPGFLSSTISRSLLKLMSIESVMLYNYLILCRPPLFLPSIFPNLRVFSNESALPIRRPKYWSFNFSISPSNECCVDFLYDWLVWSPCSPRDSQESSPASRFESINSLVLNLLYGATLTVYMTTGKTISLTILTIIGKMMSLLFNILSKFVIAFFPRRKCLLISWLQSPSTVVLEPKKRKSVTVSTFPPSICYEVMGLDAMILVF